MQHQVIRGAFLGAIIIMINTATTIIIIIIIILIPPPLPPSSNPYLRWTASGTSGGTLSSTTGITPLSPKNRCPYIHPKVLSFTAVDAQPLYAAPSHWCASLATTDSTDGSPWWEAWRDAWWGAVGLGKGALG
jgi:hypothetical protein